MELPGRSTAAWPLDHLPIEAAYVWGKLLRRLSAAAAIFLGVAGARWSAQAALPLDSLPAPITVMSTAHYKSLQDAVGQSHYLFLPAGVYRIDTPLVIDGWSDGVIVGAGRFSTRLDLAAPIRIRNCRHLLICNLGVRAVGMRAGSGASAAADVSATAGAVEITGQKAGQVDIVNVLTEGAPGPGLAVRAPARVHVQECHYSGCRTGMLVDHPGADVTVLSGNCQSSTVHIRQLAGNLAVYGVGFQGASGGADVEINHPGTRPFQVVASRSEGPADLVRVPRSPERIDVVIKANSCPQQNGFVSYGAAGKLVLVSNHSDNGAVDCTGAAASVWSFGDSLGHTWAGRHPFIADDRTTVHAIGDIWETVGKPGPRQNVLGDELLTSESIRAAGLALPAHFETGAGAPIPPISTPPLPLIPMPRIANIADLIHSVHEYGAVGDGKTDDTEALQKALDANRGGALYFPAGQYIIHRPLFLDHWAGGWLVGAGMQNTRLVNPAGGVIHTNGCGYAAFQDLAFVAGRSAENADGSAGSSDIVFDLDWDQRQPNLPNFGGAALQANTFHRCRFQGGSGGLVIGRDGYMGSETLVADCEMIRCGIGMATVNFNALSDNAVRCVFRDNDIALGQGAPYHAGSFNAFQCRFEHSRQQDIFLENEASDSFYFQDCATTSARLLMTGGKGADIPVLYERPVSSAGAAAPTATLRDGGTLAFLDSLTPLSVAAGSAIPGREAEGVIPVVVVLSIRSHAIAVKAAGRTRVLAVAPR